MPQRFTSYDSDPVTVARRLLGQRLVRVIDGRRLGGTIVEVEAYLGLKDKAAHTFRGRRTVSNASMYLGGGHAYIYFTYGMHHCLNVVTGKVNDGTAVLLRAIEPLEGVKWMFARRAAATRDTHLCSGPAKLTQALSLCRLEDGLDLARSPHLFIERIRSRQVPANRVVSTPRIGVGYAGSWARRRLRFHIKGNPHVSPGR